MVSVVHALPAAATLEDAQRHLHEGLTPIDAGRVDAALDLAKEVYGTLELGSGEPVWGHALGTAVLLAGMRLDADSRIAAVLFALPAHMDGALERLQEQFGGTASSLVNGITRLNSLRPITRSHAEELRVRPQEARERIEVLRKMLLAMVEDIRVVIIRLASRVQTLRYFTESSDDIRVAIAQETLEVYAPLANRLGVWQIKWEMEDLSFRFLHPDTYKRVAKMLEERRLEREQFIVDAVDRLRGELESAGLRAEVYGRPKHIYSIWNKMRQKNIPFSEVYDVRALRVLVDNDRDCYTALGVVHNLWQPISKEFDDYISQPKGNFYRSLHTAVQCQDGRALEVQIRTHDMHQHAEMGVAAHWRYKEKSTSDTGYDDKIALLRQLLSWKDAVADTSDWGEQTRKAALDETIYVMTPQGRVVDLAKGATAVDFAYRVHTDLGHRCRGARVDGHLVPLNTVLSTGQQVEILAAKEGGPSRDWLNTELGFLTTQHARSKVRTWFNRLALEETLAEGRSLVHREMQREGVTQLAVDTVAQRLGFASADDLYVAYARDEINLRQLVRAFRDKEEAEEEEELPLIAPSVARADRHAGGVFINGVGKLMTQLARCCKPTPPDEIGGFVTRGKGVSVHRLDCRDFANLQNRHPERVVEADWGGGEVAKGIFATDVLVEANDRTGLLRDVIDVFARERLNVIGVNTQTRQNKARMQLTVEISNQGQLKRTLQLVHAVDGVVSARRA